MGGSLPGRKAEGRVAWAAWYRKQRGLTWLSLDEYIEAALREQGTRNGLTKTKLRKAAVRLLREHQDAAMTDLVA